jgi:proteasome lid subunit RPN8/RPN11
MNAACRWFLAAALTVTAFCSDAESAVSECLRKDVQAHVRQQFAIYGPLSAQHEYFGFIYSHGGVISSAVTRSRTCTAAKCVVDATEALRSIPRPATILGEWHTHPHGGSPSLSKEDVRGAYSNRHISCYLSFYSTPSGEIYAWNPNRISVPVAMASRAPVGNYKDEQS